MYLYVYVHDTLVKRILSQMKAKIENPQSPETRNNCCVELDYLSVFLFCKNQEEAAI